VAWGVRHALTPRSALTDFEPSARANRAPQIPRRSGHPACQVSQRRRPPLPESWTPSGQALADFVFLAFVGVFEDGLGVFEDGLA